MQFVFEKIIDESKVQRGKIESYFLERMGEYKCNYTGALDIFTVKVNQPKWYRSWDLETEAKIDEIQDGRLRFDFKTWWPERVNRVLRIIVTPMCRIYLRQMNTFSRANTAV